MFRSQEETDRNNRDLSQSTLDTLAEETTKLVAGLAGIPRSLVQLCNQYFEPDKPPYKKVIKNLKDAVLHTAGSVRVTFEGGENRKSGGGAAGRRATTITTVRQWETASPPSPPSLAKDVLTTKKKSEEEDKEQDERTAGPGQEGRPETGKKSVPEGADDLSTPAGWISYTKKIGGDVTKDQLVGQLIANATANVPKQMRDKAGEIKSGLTPFFPRSPEGPQRCCGATKTQGTDFKNYWDGEDPLVDTIDTKFNRGMSDKATKDADKAAALAALEGDAKAAAIRELRAAFNLWDDEQKA